MNPARPHPTPNHVNTAGYPRTTRRTQPYNATTSNIRLLGWDSHWNVPFFLLWLWLPSCLISPLVHQVPPVPPEFECGSLVFLSPSQHPSTSKLNHLPGSRVGELNPLPGARVGGLNHLPGSRVGGLNHLPGLGNWRRCADLWICARPEDPPILPDHIIEQQ